MKRPHSITFDPAESMTKQSFKDECDINKIMAKFQRTGVLEHYAKHAPQYMDIPPLDHAEALILISEAASMFEELPSSIRKKFENNPQKFLEFVDNPDNIEQLREMGLAKPAKATERPPGKQQSDKTPDEVPPEPKPAKGPKSSASEE